MFYSRQEQLTIAVCLGVLLACVGVWVVCARSLSPVAQAPSPLVRGAPVANGEAPPLTVHVAGRVKSPGVYEVRPGQRVLDAIRLAGGHLPDADLDELNLAASLTDGEKVYVPPVPPPSAASGGSRPPAPSKQKPSAEWLAKHPINVNTATEKRLQMLPGVGPVTARAIVLERRKNGPFRRADDLVRVKGIGQKTVAKLRRFVRM